MAVSKKINWTEAALLQLVEAVTRVEEEIMQESSRPRHQRLTNKQVMPVNNDRTHPGQKWSRIANLLPPEFRGKISTRSHQVLNDFKCRHAFCQLLREYRGRRGRQTACSSRMTQPLRKMLKKWEDLRNSRYTFRIAQNRPRNQDQITDSISECSARSETVRGPYSDSFFEETNESEFNQEDSENAPQFDNVERVEREHIRQEKSTNGGQTSGSSLGSVSRTSGKSNDYANKAELAPRTGVETPAITRAKSTHRISNARSPAQISEANVNADDDNKESHACEWNEAAHLQIIDAVIKVEKERMRSIFTGAAKWDRIASQLPAKFQQRLKSRQTYKIQSVFDNLLRVYRRAKLLNHQSRYTQLTGPVVETMKKYEEVKAKGNSKSRCASLSAKKPKAHAKRSRVGAGSSQPLSDRLMQESLNKRMKHQLRDLFCRLQIQFAAELNYACEEIVQTVLMQRL